MADTTNPYKYTHAPAPALSSLYGELEQRLKALAEGIRRDTDAEDALSLLRRSYSAMLRSIDKRGGQHA